MKKNILLYIETWGSGGVESLLVNIVKEIDKKKFNMKILTAQKNSNMYDEILRDNNCEIEEILNVKYKNPFIRTFKSLKLFKSKLKEYDNIDIIHINIYNSFWLIYAWIANKVGIKNIIVHSHNTGIDNDRFKIKLLLHKLGKILFRNKNYKYLACSEEGAKFCFKKRRTEILRNGIEAQKFDFNKKTREEYRKEFKIDNKLVVGHVGRFVKQKNHDFLIDIYKEIQKIENNSVLILVGAGPLEEEIKQKVKGYGLEDKIIYLKERNDVNKLMQMMDVFCIPSLYEGLGIVLIEAQTSGLPCIISDTIPNEAIVTDIVTKKSLNETAEEWAKTIIKVAKSNKRKSQLDKVIKNGYDISENIKILEGIYLES